VTVEFELKLQTGREVKWEGDNGEAASRDYVDSHPDQVVVAWRWPRGGIYLGIRDIIEPGDWRWGRAGGDPHDDPEP
jgi:hypothetical protein